MVSTISLYGILQLLLMMVYLLSRLLITKSSGILVNNELTSSDNNLWLCGINVPLILLHRSKLFFIYDFGLLIQGYKSKCNVLAIREVWLLKFGRTGLTGMMEFALISLKEMIL